MRPQAVKKRALKIKQLQPKHHVAKKDPCPHGATCDDKGVVHAQAYNRPVGDDLLGGLENPTPI